MKMLSIVLILGTLLASSLSFARSCKDEPERCPVLLMTCSFSISAEKFLNASVYHSLFSGKSIQVSETNCVQNSCQTKTVAGSFEIYPSGMSHTLVNKLTGERVLFQCSVINRGGL